jgi:hypothetical protein
VANSYEFIGCQGEAVAFVGDDLLNYFYNLQSTVTDIDQVLDDMGNADADQRPDAQDALDRIRKVVHSIPPESLLIPPWIEKDWFSEFQAKLELQNSNNNVNSSQ